MRIKNRGERLVTFNVGATTYSFDPNRMFTKMGRLTTLGAGVTISISLATPQTDKQTLGKAAGEPFVDTFQQKVLAIYGVSSVSTILTLHNNGGSTYSAKSYAKGGEYQQEAAAIQLRPSISSFVFLTKQSTYDCLAKTSAKFSIVLQTPNIATVAVESNEGSFSQLAETLVRLVSLRWFYHPYIPHIGQELYKFRVVPRHWFLPIHDDSKCAGCLHFKTSR